MTRKASRWRWISTTSDPESQLISKPRCGGAFVWLVGARPPDFLQNRDRHLLCRAFIFGRASYEEALRWRMAKATGIGGAFLRAKDPKALYAWYEKHLGLERRDGCFGFEPAEQRARAVVAFFPI